MKKLLYLIFLLPSYCFCAPQPFFAGTAANALHANIADGLTAGTTAYGATGLVGGTYNYYGTNPVTMNAQNAVTAGTCTGNAATSTNSTQLNGHSASYYATQSEFNSIGISTSNIYSQLQSTGIALSVESSNVATSTNSLQGQIAGLQNSTSNYANFNNVTVSTASLQTEINNIGISTGNITTNFNTYISAVNVSTTSIAQTDSNQNTAIGVLQNNLFAYGGQQILNVNFSTGTSFVNVDTTTYNLGIGMLPLLTGNNNADVGGVITMAINVGSYNAIYQLFDCGYTATVSAVTFSVTPYSTNFTSGNADFKIMTSTYGVIYSSAVPYTDFNWLTPTINFNQNLILSKGVSYYLYLDTGTLTGNTSGISIRASYFNPSTYAAYLSVLGSWGYDPFYGGYLGAIFNISYASSTNQTASYSTVFSSSSLNIFNNGGFYTWGKFTTSDNQSTVSGSSITYTVAFSTNGANTWTTPQTIVNGTLLNSNTPYMQFNEYFNRWVSTATPITNSASFNINYSAPLINLQSYSNIINASSMTVTNGISFGVNGNQTTAYKVLVSSTLTITAGNFTGNNTLQTVIGSTMAITTSGNTRLWITGIGDYYGDTAGQTSTLNIVIDNVGIQAAFADTTVTGKSIPLPCGIISNYMPAGVHYITLRFSVNSGSANLQCTSGFPYYLNVQEIK